MTVKIRQAQVEDAPLIAEAEKIIAQEPGYLCSSPLEISEKKVKQSIESLEGIYLVAEKEGQIVGHAFLEQMPLKSIHHVAILTICVHKGHQGEGIGTRLMERLIEWAKQSDTVEKIELNVRASNSRAIALYKKMGFHQEGSLEKRVKVGNRYIDDILMALFVKQEQLKNTDLVYHLEHYNTIPQEYEKIIFSGISDNAYRAKGLFPIRQFSVFLKDQAQNVLGGVSGSTYYGSLYVDMLWVDKTLRHQGWGTKLVHEAEKIGKERGAVFAILNTMDWEALSFYKKLGYSLEFTRAGYEKDSKMFLLRKNL